MPWTKQDIPLTALLVIAFVALCLIFGSIAQGKSNDEMRAYCRQHGGVLIAADDGGRIIAVTCRDGAQFQQ